MQDDPNDELPPITRGDAFFILVITVAIILSTTDILR